MIKKLLILAVVLFSINVFAAPVNINTADAKTIAEALAGVGLKKAQAIVDYRMKNGDFKSINDLAQVTGIGSKTIEKNKNDILLNDLSISEPGEKSDNSEMNPPKVTTFETDDFKTITITVEKKKHP